MLTEKNDEDYAYVFSCEHDGQNIQEMAVHGYPERSVSLKITHFAFTQFKCTNSDSSALFLCLLTCKPPLN